jgi:ribose/xylose/arabinose/galactoside ABC-type transport system permease subunit
MSTQPIDRRRGREEVSPFLKWVRSNRRVLTSAGFLLAMLIAFIIANPDVFTQFRTYRSVMIALPIAIFLVVPLVFVTTAGEIDLAFPAIVGLSSYSFALIVDSGGNAFLGLLAALATGALLGYFNGTLIVNFGLSALVSTLGMNFLLRGLINILAQGYSRPISEIRGTPLQEILTGSHIFGIPNQMLWAIAFALFGMFLYNYHKFGIHVHCIGDHPGSSQEMGINVNRTRILLFVFSGVGAALAGLFSVMINFVWYPTTGDALLLPVLAGIFVGGTPTWGGIGTVLGGVFGVSIVSFIETGVIAAGLTGFWTQFVYGIIIITSLIGHRLNGSRVR